MAPRHDKMLTRSNITACLRCRQKKQKCDQKLPSCSPCQKAKSDCVGYDAVAKRHAPRSYIVSLEERVAALEIRLRNHGISEDDIGDCIGNQNGTMADPDADPNGIVQHMSLQSGTEVNSNIEAILSKSIQVTVESLSDHPYIGSCNGMSFTRLFLSELQWAGAETQSTGEMPKSGQAVSEYVTFEAPKGLDAASVTLPERNTAEYLIKVYFELANFSLPILHEPTFRHQFNNIYDQEVESDVAIKQRKRGLVLCYLVFAIALLVLQKKDSESVSTSLCERYHRSALQYLNEAGLDMTVESVQILLLLANYSYLHPSFLGTWKLVGMAARLAIELGLHQDPAPESLNALDLDIRRRTFWVTYSMDRNLGIYLGRPFSFADGAVNVELLSAVQDDFITEAGIANDISNQASKKVFAIHYFRYRQLQSELYTVLHERRPYSNLPIDYSAWQQDMYHRLSQWHKSTPRNTSPSYIAPPEGLEISYYTALILLFKPSPAIPSSSESSLVLLAKAASQTIRLYRRCALEKKLNLLWQASHNMFAAGTAMLYSFSHSSEVRNQISKHSLISDVNSCAAVLWALVERFPAARGTRDAFDTILSAALKSLSDTNDYDCSNYPPQSETDESEQQSNRFNLRDNSVADCFGANHIPGSQEYSGVIASLRTGNIDINGGGWDEMDMNPEHMAVNYPLTFSGTENDFDLTLLPLDPSLYGDLN